MPFRKIQYPHASYLITTNLSANHPCLDLTFLSATNLAAGNKMILFAEAIPSTFFVQLFFFYFLFLDIQHLDNPSDPIWTARREKLNQQLPSWLYCFVVGPSESVCVCVCAFCSQHNRHDRWKIIGSMLYGVGGVSELLKVYQNFSLLSNQDGVLRKWNATKRKQQQQHHMKKTETLQCVCVCV